MFLMSIYTGGSLCKCRWDCRKQRKLNKPQSMLMYCIRCSKGGPETCPRFKDHTIVGVNNSLCKHFTKFGNKKTDFLKYVNMTFNPCHAE